jgi:hypothetical protein
MDDEVRAERSRRMTTRKFASASDADRLDIDYWTQLSDAERVLQTWRLSVELWQLHTGVSDEPGLCRSVARVVRR